MSLMIGLSGRGRPAPQAFFTNSDFNCIEPNPSILQSMSWSPSIRRMLLTFVPPLQDRGCTLDLEILDHQHRIPVVQHVAISVFPHSRFRDRLDRADTPLMAAFRTDQQAAVFVRVLRAAFRARGQTGHIHSFRQSSHHGCVLISATNIVTSSPTFAGGTGCRCGLSACGWQ